VWPSVTDVNPYSSETKRPFVSLIETAELASLGPGPRVSRKPLSSLNKELENFFSRNSFAPEAQPLIRAIVLLWHDYLDESHSIAQDISSSDGSLIHAIMHRREPDYSNSKYWFSKAGGHSSYPKLAQEVAPLLKSATNDFATTLLIGEKWTPNAFVGLCQQFAEKASAVEYKLLQQIQQIETFVLLGHFFDKARR
jgi:hypothetical protein